MGGFIGFILEHAGPIGVALCVLAVYLLHRFDMLPTYRARIEWVEPVEEQAKQLVQVGQRMQSSEGKERRGYTPTCWGCAMWLHSLDHPHTTPTERARVLARITEETPYGEPMTDRDDHAPRRRLTRYERLEAVADSGCDTREEYEGLR